MSATKSPYIGQDGTTILVDVSRLAKGYIVLAVLVTIVFAAFEISAWDKIDASTNTFMVFIFMIYLGFLARKMLYNQSKTLQVEDDHAVVYKKWRFKVDHIQVFSLWDGRRHSSGTYGVSLVGSIDDRRREEVMLMTSRRSIAVEAANNLAEALHVDVLLPEYWPWGRA